MILISNRQINLRFFDGEANKNREELRDKSEELRVKKQRAAILNYQRVANYELWIVNWESPPLGFAESQNI